MAEATRIFSQVRGPPLTEADEAVAGSVPWCGSVAPTLRQRLREYFHQSVTLRRHHATQKLLTQMSPMLQAELVAQTNGHLLDAVPMLAGTESEFQVEVALNLIATVP